MKRFSLILAVLAGFFLGCAPESSDPVTILNYPGELGSTYLGAGQGTRFAVFAPQASAVYVAGTFNGFDTASHPMTRTGAGVWELVIDNAAPGHYYKYYSSDFNGQWVRDPYGRSFNGSDNDNTIIVHNSYSWGDSGWVRPERAALVIYEMHVKDFTRGDSQAVGGANYQGMIDKIPYLSGLGINAVELMPIQDWTGNSYSWGYNSAAYFAPENSLSDNPANGKAYQDFKELVDALHQAGIAVILDVVYNHTFEDSPLWLIHPESYYDTAAAIPWGKKLDLTRPGTRRYVEDNLRFWLDEFHVDGFRLDATEYIDNPTLQDIISGLREEGYADRYFICEEWNGAHNAAYRSYNSSAGGQYISSWGTGYKNTIWDLLDNGTSADMGKVTYYSKEDGWNYPAEVINFFSSHDEGTLTGHKGASPQQVRLAHVHLLTSLGIPMLWMGEEVLNPHYGNNPPGGEGTDETNNTIDWDTLRADNSEIYDYVSALVRLRIAHPALRQNVSHPDGSADTFDWFSLWGEGLIGYALKRVPGDNDFLVQVNYSSSDKTNSVTFPRSGTWYVMADHTGATHLSPGLYSFSVGTGATNLIIPAGQARLFMSQAVN